MSGTRAELGQVLEVIRTAQKALGAARRRVEEQMLVADGQGVLEDGGESADTGRNRPRH